MTPLPATIAASLVPCAAASSTFDVQPHGMAFNQTFEVTLTITADQIAPSTRTVTFRTTGVETDFAAVATRTYNFNAGMDGWTVNSGTFTRVDGGWRELLPRLLELPRWAVRHRALTRDPAHRDFHALADPAL